MNDMSLGPTRRLSRLHLARSITLAAVLVSPALAAAGPTDDLRRELVPVAIALLHPCLATDPASEVCRSRMQAAMGRIADPRDLAQRVLGVHWQRATEAQRRDFTEHLAVALARRLRSRFAVADTREPLKFIGETRDGEFTLIQAEHGWRPGAAVPIELRVRRQDDRWLIHDLLIEKKSFVGRLRDDYNAIAFRDGVAGVIASLKREIAGPPQGSPPLSPPGKALWAQVLDFAYTIAHRLGQGIVLLAQKIMPTMRVPAELGDAMGFMALLTVAVVAAHVAGKVMWWALIAGWALIVARLALLLAGHDGTR